MTHDLEQAICGGLLCEPEKTIEYAWATLRAADFRNDAHRWLFEVMVQWWHTRKGDVAARVAADDIEGQVAAQLTRQHLVELIYNEKYKLPDAGLLWTENLVNAYLGETMHRWHVEMLANEGAVRQVRALLYRWYSFFVNLELRDPDGVPIGVSVFLALDNDPAGQVGMERVLTGFYEGGYSLQGKSVPPASAQATIVAVLLEMLEALKRAPVVPRMARARETAREVPKVGEWD